MYKRKDNIDISGFKQYCSKCLKMVMDSLLNFDFMSMLYEGCSIVSIWNATNLFFRQELLFDKVFPPICFIEFENKKLQDFRKTKTGNVLY